MHIKFIATFVTVLTFGVSGCASDRDWDWKPESAMMPLTDVMLPTGEAAIRLNKCYRTPIFKDLHCQSAVGMPRGPIVEFQRIRDLTDSFLLSLPESTNWRVRMTNWGRASIGPVPRAPYRLFLMSVEPMVVVILPQDLSDKDSSMPPNAAGEIICSGSVACLGSAGRVWVNIDLTGPVAALKGASWFSPEYPGKGLTPLPLDHPAEIVLPGLRASIVNNNGVFVFKRLSGK